MRSEIYIFCNENKNWRMNSVLAGNSSWIRDGSHFTPWLNRSSVPDTLAFQDCQDSKKMCGYILWNCQINSCLWCFRKCYYTSTKTVNYDIICDPSFINLDSIESFRWETLRSLCINCKGRLNMKFHENFA